MTKVFGTSNRYHFQKNRKARDTKVKSICNNAGIKLITFWTQFDNTKEYIINRIKNELKK